MQVLHTQTKQDKTKQIKTKHNKTKQSTEKRLRMQSCTHSFCMKLVLRPSTGRSAAHVQNAGSTEQRCLSESLRACARAFVVWWQFCKGCLSSFLALLALSLPRATHAKPPCHPSTCQGRLPLPLRRRRRARRRPAGRGEAGQGEVLRPLPSGGGRHHPCTSTADSERAPRKKVVTKEATETSINANQDNYCRGEHMRADAMMSEISTQRQRQHASASSHLHLHFSHLHLHHHIECASQNITAIGSRPSA